MEEMYLLCIFFLFLYIVILGQGKRGKTMNTVRVNEILKNKEKCEVLYEQRPVWIQDVRDNIAHISFIDTFEEKNVYIEDLYESNLYQ